MNPDYNREYNEMKYARERYERERYERERYERERYGRERNGNTMYGRERGMVEHIAYLEEKCKRLEHLSCRSNEEILHNMDINFIEKYLRRKKIENLNNK